MRSSIRRAWPIFPLSAFLGLSALSETAIAQPKVPSFEEAAMRLDRLLAEVGYKQSDDKICVLQREFDQRSVGFVADMSIGMYVFSQEEGSAVLDYYAREVLDYYAREESGAYVRSLHFPHVQGSFYRIPSLANEGMGVKERFGRSPTATISCALAGISSFSHFDVKWEATEDRKKKEEEEEELGANTKDAIEEHKDKLKGIVKRVVCTLSDIKDFDSVTDIETPDEDKERRWKIYMSQRMKGYRVFGRVGVSQSEAQAFAMFDSSGRFLSCSTTISGATFDGRENLSPQDAQKAALRYTRAKFPLAGGKDWAVEPYGREKDVHILIALRPDGTQEGVLVTAFQPYGDNAGSSGEGTPWAPMIIVNLTTGEVVEEEDWPAIEE